MPAEAKTKFVHVENELSSIKSQFGDEVQDQLVHQLRSSGLLHIEEGKAMLSSSTLQSAQRDISNLVKKAIAGAPQAIGGFKQVAPVVVFPLEALADLINKSRKAQSMADLLPDSLPPLDDSFEVAPSTPHPRQVADL